MVNAIGVLIFPIFIVHTLLMRNWTQTGPSFVWVKLHILRRIFLDETDLASVPGEAFLEFGAWEDSGDQALGLSRVLMTIPVLGRWDPKRKGLVTQAKTTRSKWPIWSRMASFCPSFWYLFEKSFKNILQKYGYYLLQLWLQGSPLAHLQKVTAELYKPALHLEGLLHSYLTFFHSWPLLAQFPELVAHFQQQPWEDVNAE